MVNTTEAAVDAAAAGLGSTRVLSYQAAGDIKAGTLQLILDEVEPEPLSVNMVCPTRGLPPLKTRAFPDFAAPKLRDALHVQ